MKIAIIEDEAEAREALAVYIHRYESERSVFFELECYENGLNMQASDVTAFDLIFLDIEMPFIDGMSLAQKIRKADESVCLVFVTNLAHYAVRGYDVEALGFLIKPVVYRQLSTVLDRALHARERSRDEDILIKSSNGIVRMSVRDILYIEVCRHTLIYHTLSGNYEARGVIRDEAEHLRTHHFHRCSQSYLVNLAKVLTIEDGEVVIGRERIPISKSKKAEFMTALTNFVGNGES